MEKIEEIKTSEEKDPELAILEIREKRLDILKKKYEFLKFKSEYEAFDAVKALKMTRDRLYLEKIEKLNYLLSDFILEDGAIPGDIRFTPILSGKEREVVMDKMIDMVLRL